MKYTTVIFDMDGTIVDSEKLWIEAIFELLLERNIPVTDELKHTINTSVCGMHVTDMCEAVKRICSLPDSIQALVNDLEKHVFQLYEQNLHFIPGFLEFFDQLKNMGIKTAIATNATDEALKITDRILNLTSLFGKHMYGVSCVDNIKKPAPDIFLYAAKQLNSHPDECIVFEDSRLGIQAAHAAGMYVIGIEDGSVPELTQNADTIIKNFCGLDAQRLSKGDFAKLG